MEVTRKSIPLDIISEIVQNVDPSQLPTLALVCRRSQVDAERLLYRSLFLPGDNAKPARSCLETIITVPHKARLVRSMAVSWWTTPGVSKRKALGNALLALTSLKHLRLRFPSIRSTSIMKIINPILKRCTFSLTMLFISDYIDLAGWVPKQKSLKTIGVYTSLEVPFPKTLSVYKDLLEKSPPDDPLTLFSLSREGGLTDTICAFPMYSQNWSAKHIQASLIHALTPCKITRFNLVLSSLSDESVLRPVITSISEHISQIEELRLIVNDPNIHMKPDIVSSILSRLPLLSELFIDYHGLDRGTVSPYQENKDRLANSWAAQCPKLNFVIFPDLTSSSINSHSKIVPNL